MAKQALDEDTDAEVDDKVKGKGGNDADADAQDPKLTKLVNQAITSHLKRHGKNLSDSFAAMLDERLAAFGQPAAAPAKDDKGAGAGASGASDETRAEVEQLRSELKAQKLRGIEKEVFADVRAYLAGKVRPEHMDTAIKLLKADGKIKINARTETATFKSDDGDLELSEGLAEWLSGEGALFAPVKAPQRGNGPGPASRAPSRAPARPSGGSGGNGNENLTPAQRTQLALQKRGLVLNK